MQFLEDSIFHVSEVNAVDEAQKRGGESAVVITLSFTLCCTGHENKYFTHYSQF